MKKYLAAASAPASFLRPGFLAAVVGIASFGMAQTARAQETPPAAPPAAPTAPTAPTTTPDAPPAAAPAAPQIDAEARALLDQMVKAHQALTSFSGTMDFSVQQGDKTMKQQAKIAYQKPNKARISTNNPTNGAAVVTVSNGTSLFQTVSTEKNGYRKGVAAPDAKAIAQVIGASKAAGIGLFPMLATQPSVGKEILPPGVTSLSRGADETINGVLCDVVLASFSPKPDAPVTLTFGVGKVDHLLRRLNLTQTGAASGQKLGLNETYSDVQGNPAFPPSTFVFVPSPGMKEIRPAAPTKPAAAAAEPAAYDVRLKKGAAPLPFKGNDLAGQPVSLAAYKGKVVLLDFWATWCPPCREEVPNIVRTYNKYHGQGLEIVGVSLDREGDKEKLISYTKENKMPWRQVYDGKYWQAAMAQAYGVQSIPFSVLVGRDGKIIAVGDKLRGEDLEPAVKAALAAK